jgi:hypothetical protein
VTYIGSFGPNNPNIKLLKYLEGDRCFDGNRCVVVFAGSMRGLWQWLILGICFHGTRTVQSLRFQKVQKTEIKKETVPQLDSDLLPSLESLLEELNLSHRKSALVKLGVTETRYLLRLKSMDFQMMVSPRPFIIYHHTPSAHRMGR